MIVDQYHPIPVNPFCIFWVLVVQSRCAKQAAQAALPNEAIAFRPPKAEEKGSWHQPGLHLYGSTSQHSKNSGSQPGKNKVQGHRKPIEMDSSGEITCCARRRMTCILNCELWSSSETNLWICLKNMLCSWDPLRLAPTLLLQSPRSAIC